MPSYLNSNGNSIGSLLRFIQEQKSQSPIIPQSSEVGSPIRGVVQEPLKGSESIGTSRQVSIKPEAALGQGGQPAVLPPATISEAPPVPTPVPTPTLIAQKSSPSVQGGSQSQGSSQPSNQPSATPKTSGPSLGTSIKATTPQTQTSIPRRENLYEDVRKLFTPAPSRVGPFIAPNTIPTPTPAPNDIQKAIQGGKGALDSFMKRFTPQIGRSWLA